MYCTMCITSKHSDADTQNENVKSLKNRNPASLRTITIPTTVSIPNYNYNYGAHDNVLEIRIIFLIVDVFVSLS